jgi:excisionase family DNA binding protein
MAQALPRQMLTVAQAVQTSGIGRTSLYAAIRDGRLEARKHGRRTLVPAAALARMLDSLPRVGKRAA